MTDAQKDQAIGRTSPWELAIGPEPVQPDDGRVGIGLRLYLDTVQ